MFPVNEGSQGDRLNALFRAYHDACGSPEPGVNFMPELWQKIEARQTFSFSFGRVARGFVTAAIAATLAMAIYLVAPLGPSAVYTTTYIDVLDASHNADSTDAYETVRYETGSIPDEL
jgi:hypothetical protein